jgi:hypothetical protein
MLVGDVGIFETIAHLLCVKHQINVPPVQILVQVPAVRLTSDRVTIKCNVGVPPFPAQVPFGLFAKQQTKSLRGTKVSRALIFNGGKFGVTDFKYR